MFMKYAAALCAAMLAVSLASPSIGQTKKPMKHPVKVVTKQPANIGTRTHPCGPYVKALQGSLNNAGQKIKEDGICGSKTIAAIKAFQKAKGLKTDGIAGKITMTALPNG